MTSGPISLEPPPPEEPRGERVGAWEVDASDRSGERRWLRWALPLLAITVGVAIFALLWLTKERPKTQDVTPPAPLVRTMLLSPEDLRLSVSAQGTVMPRTESDLVAEVRGRVVWLSPNLVVGGFFDKGEELLRLDDREYRIARDRARASVTLAESESRLASAEARRRRELRRRGAASEADLEQFESRDLVAKANLAQARATLEQAELDLERTVLVAPYEGRVRERSVDVGRFVSAGTKLGRIFAIDFAEVRLPIQTDDLAFLDIDLGSSGRQQFQDAGVMLRGRLGGREFTWPAELARAEAAIDAQSRMLVVVARVEDPYAQHVQPAQTGAQEPGEEAVEEAPRASPRVPLPAGLFVTAEIEGRSASGVFVLPMMALRDGNRVFVVEEGPPNESTDVAAASLDPPAANPSAEAEVAAAFGAPGVLRIRDVSVLRRERSQVVIDGGLEPGERIVISPLRIFSEGMRLRIAPGADS